ncbi:MAG: undecaprenyl-phosphate glucose phosphotransferase [Desulfomicrobium sp.]
MLTRSGSRQWMIGLALKVSDAFLGVLIFALCQYAYHGFVFQSLIYKFFAVLIILLSPVCLEISGAYRTWSSKVPRFERRSVIFGCILVYLCLMFVAYAFKISGAFSRVIVISWFVAWPVALVMLRKFVRIVLRYRNGDRVTSQAAIIVGAGDLGVSVVRYLDENGWLGVDVVGLFDDKKEGVLDGKPVLGRTDTVASYAREHRVEYVFLALPMRAEDKVKRLVTDLTDSTATVYLVPDIFQFEMMLSGAPRYFGEIPTIALWESPFIGVNAALKRLFDIVFATVALIVISPVLFAFTLAIKFSSPGPVFFTQQRYGLRGEPFWILKFRTMTVCEDGNDFVQCTKCDPRVTRLGAFMRKYSLDELPQFFNVLQGKMSVVGPRPHAISMNEEYRKLVSGYMLRHKVKPGVTGLAQVSGFRGETDTMEKMEGRVQKDLEYIKTWTLFLDMKIIVKTIWGGFTGWNAY